MKSSWKVAKKPVSTSTGTGYIYQVYRLRNQFATDLSGNREVFDAYISRDVAEMKAEELNRMEETASNSTEGIPGLL